MRNALKNKIALRAIAFLMFAFTQGFAQKLEAEIGYKFNNDFRIYYKDLKPFYYSGATFDLLIKHKDGEYILGVRYMPYLNSVKPEIGFNYYVNHDPDKKFNYFFHTTVFFNNYSYNTKVGYENYNYVFNGSKPAGYSAVKFRSFVHDLALGLKMGLTPRWTIDFMAGGGYYYGLRDSVEGDLFKQKTKDDYWGIQYNFRLALKYVIAEKRKVEENGFNGD